MSKQLPGLFLITLLCLSDTGYASSVKKIYLTSLEWPPYSSSKLPDGGASVAIAKAAFLSMGYQLEVEFFPWTRAINEARNPNSRYSGYFPEYYSEEVAREFLYSQPMGSSPLALVENTLHPVYWRKISDLSPYVIGTVQNYINTREFDLRVASGLQKTEAVINDLTNIKKVAANRIPAAIIDKNVFHYLLNTDKRLSLISDNVRINQRLLEKKQLYLCFRNTPRGRYLSSVYNKGLKNLDTDSMIKSYIKALLHSTSEQTR